MKTKNSKSRKPAKSSMAATSKRSTTSMNGSAPLDASAAAAFCDQYWEREIVPTISEYIAIPNKSPYYDPDWVKNGHMDRAVALVEKWLKARLPAGATLEVMRLNDEQGKPRTPLIFIELPGATNETVLLYGHLDKQPEMTGWRSGLDPWKPVREGDRIFGRGGADDGYAAFATMAAIALLAEQRRPHARLVVVIECCEESGSYDLPHHIDALKERIGEPTLVVCLDSGCGNYDQLWTTTSLRGLLAGNLKVEILKEGVHSGDASGIVPSTFRILRQILSRLEDPKSGAILPKQFHVKIPPARAAQAKICAKTLGPGFVKKFPWVDGAKPLPGASHELLLNRTWRPTLSITGVEGIPPLGSAGNVLRPFTTVKVSVRIPPRLDPKPATAALKKLLESDPPYGAKVTFDADKGSPGWDAPPFAPWLEASMERASKAFYGKGCASMGEGGTIPFMGMLGENFPRAQFLITGVLGPGSNAHGPNEFLDVAYAKKLTACVAQVVADQVTGG
jgi:acetylornithine deacetylase/succinyl-diaminopimelate desuccinylase-like protein